VVILFRVQSGKQKPVRILKTEEVCYSDLYTVVNLLKSNKNRAHEVNNNNIPPTTHRLKGQKEWQCYPHSASGVSTWQKWNHSEPFQQLCQKNHSSQMKGK
jgi:hypothetical protein